MATQLWNQEIDKTVDWGGDTSTGGAAVSGQFIQKFIKDTLAKKFGYLYYDRQDTKKYLLFADEADFIKWRSNSETYADLLLATFDAPAPATIFVESTTPENVTILSSEKNQVIGFNYYIVDSAQRPMNERVTARITFNNAGVSQSITESYEPDYDGYNKPRPDGASGYLGATKTINIDQYLKEGTNNITVTLTGLTTQATANLSFKYTVVNLKIESSFDNSKAQIYDLDKDPDLVYDIQNGNVITIPFSCSGQGEKFIEIFVNGEAISQSDIRNALSTDDSLGRTQDYSSSLNLFMTNKNGELRSNFHEGKNSIQFRVYILDANSNKIYSKTLYYDVILKNILSSEEIVMILYKQSFNNGADVFKPEDIIKFNTQQYESAEFEYSVYSSSGKKIDLIFNIDQEQADGTTKRLATLNRSVNSGDVDTFAYTFMTYGKVNITIETVAQKNGTPLDTLNVEVAVNMAEVQIAVYQNDLLLELTAMNRSNSEPEDQRNKWQDPNNPGAFGGRTVKFNDVYFNDATGWIDNALLLNNGATVEIPYNIFGLSGANGLTFEMTFEVVNVQDEEAPIFTFADTNNDSYIKLTASEAKIQDQGGNNVNTKFNSNTKLKMAFIINPYDATYKEQTYTEDKPLDRNSMYVIINGILDRGVASSSQGVTWTGANNPTIKIGNVDGKAGVKLYSLRVYNKSLSLDEELTNWIAESDSILSNYKRNNIYISGTNNPSLDILKEMIPVLVIYGDVDAMNDSGKTGNKKDNYQMDLEFYDPFDPERDFYARGCWVSPQGTSSLAYPVRNLRPYFSKSADNKSKDNGQYWTEVYLAGEFTHSKVNDESTLGHFYCNKKSAKSGWHKCYNVAEAKKLEKTGEQIFYKGKDAEGATVYIPCSLGENTLRPYADNTELADYPEGTKDFYVYSTREVKAFKNVNSLSERINKDDLEYADMYWKFIKELRLSGQTLYTAKESTYKNPISGVEYPLLTFKKVKGKEALKKSTTYYILQGVWKQYEKSGWTTQWTLKADYAESSMCNNAGTGRLWGDAMKGFKINNEQLGMTYAQQAMQTYGNNMVDIRTSCDGKPIVCFNAAPKRDDDGNIVEIDGVRQYETPKYTGLYNIMTDKASTPLFGFENIYDEKGGVIGDGSPIYDASKCECWESLTNAAEVNLGLEISPDRGFEEVTVMSKRAGFFNNYEARWPDAKDSTGGACAHTNKIESFWRFINFCKPAVDYKVGGSDGYTLSPYIKIKDTEELQKYWDMGNNRPQFATGEMKSGNMEYKILNPSSIEDLVAVLNKLYRFENNIDYSDVSKTLSGTLIKDDIYKAKVAGFDAKHGEYVADIQFDAERIDSGNVKAGDPIKDSPYEEDYYMDVYVSKNGSQWQYTDEYGKTSAAPADAVNEDCERNSKGESYKGKTYMEYFSEKKYDWLNVYRVAAYYVYIMRFAAVDQVVKNTMMTTEDGQHWYFINYDNDTILGVRNDGALVFHWNIDRNSFDYQKNSFCFAGPKSVLWNLLECDEDFMNIVKEVDNAMFTSKVLSASIALDMYNVKQEASWGERMYNVNQEHKYLRQWAKGDDKFSFIHGSSNQYRSWFITNRFNLYDSLWETGDYLTTKVYFRMNVSNVTLQTTTPMFNITAARQNKFVLSNSDGSWKNWPDWKIEIPQGENANWLAVANIQGTSSPWSLYGADKIKVLDFRSATSAENIVLQDLSFVDGGVTWMDDKGCLMTGLLIGTSDDYRETTMYRYTNVTSGENAKRGDLFTVTVTKDKEYESTTELPEFYLEDVKDDIQMREEDGKFIYFTEKDGSFELPTLAVKPGEFVDRVNPIASYDTTIFAVSSVAPTVCVVEKIDGVNKLKSLEEIDIRNCFNASSQFNDSFQINALSNLHIFRAIGSSITTFIPAVGCSFTEISLPKNRITTIVLDSVSFSQTYDTEGNAIEQFKYTPDAALRSFTINGVSMEKGKEAIDIVKFITTWQDNYMKSYTGDDRENALKNLSVTLKGVDIEADVNWLRTFKKMGITNEGFTGRVFVRSSENADGVLTQNEYEELNSLYAAEHPFEADSALRFDAEDAVFWTVQGGNKVENAETWSGDRVEYYYEILHGETFKFRATQFPIDPDLKQNYRFYYFRGNDIEKENNKWGQQSWATSDSNVTYFRETDVIDMSLTVEQSGLSSFISALNNNANLNLVRYVKIVALDKDNKPNYNAVIYVKINQVFEPSEINLKMDGESLTYTTVDGKQVFNITINKNLDEHKFEIRYTNANQVTVNSIKPFLSLEEGNEEIVDNYLGVIRNVKVNADRRLGSEFTFAPRIQPTSTTIPVYITALFNTGLNSTGQGSLQAILNVRVETVLPNTIEILIPDELKDNKLIYTSSVNITKNELDENGNETGRVVTKNNCIKLSINAEIPANGFKFPIKPCISTKNGINFDTVNVPIKSFKDISYDYNAPKFNNRDFISVPEIVNEDNDWFIVVKPVSRNTWGKSFDVEYDLYLDGEFGYEGGDWDSKSFEFNNYFWRLDASVIYPNDIKIVHENGDNIEDNPLIIRDSDGNSKVIKLIVVPFDKDQSDDVTVDVTFENFKLTILPSDINISNLTWNGESGSVIQTITEGFLPEDFINAEFIERGSNIHHYPEINITLHKYSEDDNVKSTIVYLRPRIEIGCKYKPINGTSFAPSIKKEINFSAEQTLSSCSIIDDCAEYNIGTESSPVMCPWYFVDTSNQYYRFNSSILDKLTKSGRLNSLVGIAKRVQYGWGDSKVVNVELEGNKFNNACTVWKNDPHINIIDFANNKFKMSYYRALCIPLANWKVDDSEGSNMMATIDDFVSTDPGNWGQIGKTLNNNYGAWALSRIPLMNKNISHYANYPLPFNTLLSKNFAPSIAETFTRIVLHENLTNVESGKLVDYCTLRSTTGTTMGTGYDNSGTEISALRRRGCFDIKDGIKYLCSGEIPSWVKTPQGFSGMSSLAYDNIIFPGYGDRYNETSGLLDTWFHFYIYDNALICNTNNNQINDDIIEGISKLHCYPASLYELDNLFNGSLKSQGKQEIKVVNSSGDVIIGYGVPYGIYELYNYLVITKCFDAFTRSNNGYDNLFISKLVKFFTDGNNKDALFSSLYYIPTQQRSTPSLGNHNTDNVISFNTKTLSPYFGFCQDDKISEERIDDNNVIVGSGKPVIFIPLLIVK